jgi:hypothetical protein
MPESKNTFIKSKMNQDLDARLIPNGEYREAFNVSISQSEGADVGTLQTVLGNVEYVDFTSDDYCNVKIIGYFVDEQSKNIYIFVTNFTDTTSDKLSGYPSDEATCQIWVRNIEKEKTIKLVEGKFLNFSLTHPINGVNIIEDLLFWTDNRNQPRKINVNKANPGEVQSPTYYNNDDHINVAKYYPHEPISLIKDYIVDYSLNGGTSSSSYNDYEGEVVRTTGGSGTGLTVKIVQASAVTGVLQAVEIINQGNGYENGDVINVEPKVGDATLTLTVEQQSTMKDKCTEKLPVNSTFAPNSGTPSLTSGTAFQVAAPSEGPDLDEIDYVGALVKITSADDSPYLARVTAQNPGSTPKTLTIEWPNAPTSVSTVTQIEVGINPDYDADWPGDCEYLKDKFVRFAYRFKFDDNEYSLISPFTQACFIPKQDGYFLSKTLTEPDGTEATVLDADKAFEDTDVEFFQNKVTDITMQIPCPLFLDESIENFNSLTQQMHVESIEIIYKDDSENVIKLLDTIEKKDFANLDSDVLSYSYQSRQPIKTLSENEITRVSDRVPIKALAQEVAGNRVIYGNYVDGYTSVRTLNYEVAGSEKSTSGESKKEYQNHTLKQNRTYQVGIVLTDRYGRNSDVILSSLDASSSTSSSITFTGSTIFHEFYDTGFSSSNLVRTNNTTWNGDALRVKFNSQIPTNTGQLGYPGLFIGYDAPSISNLYGGTGYNQADGTNAATDGGTGTGLTVDFVTEVPTVSRIISVTINDPGSGYTTGDLITIPGTGAGSPPASFIYNPAELPNLTGWYSYKIVVKQTEQEYYNVYLPGIINGTINRQGESSAIEASVSLYSDNINKVPKDLSEVGPSQTNYNSNVQLSLRVINENTPTYSSVQFYPGTDIEKVTQISEMSDLGLSLERFTKRVSAAPSTNTFTYGGASDFDDRIVPGQSIIFKNDSGGIVAGYDENIYVKSSYVDGSNDATVIASKDLTTLTPPVTSGDVATFGPPGVVYNSNYNPLIGILSTSTGIGVSEEDGFNLNLAIAETKPFESLLDIYYETSTSGLIKTLNSDIEEGLPTTIPVRISGIDFTLNEGNTGTTKCTNNFNLVDSLNEDINSTTVTGDLISVFDKNNNNRTSEFRINDENNGEFSLSIVKPAGEGVYIGQDDNETSFDFNVQLTYDDVSILSSFSGFINNVKPIYQGSYDGASYNISKAGGSWGGPNPGDIFECFNGSGDNALRDKEVRWELVSAVATDGSNASRPAGMPSELLWPNDNPSTVAWVPTSSQTSTFQPLIYQVLEGQDYSSRFKMVDTDNSANTSIGNFLTASKMRFNYGGLRTFGVIPLQDTSGNTSPFNTSTEALVNYIEFTFTFKAVDRNGNGISGGTITQTIKAQ